MGSLDDERENMRSARSLLLLRDRMLRGAGSLHGALLFMDSSLQTWTPRELFEWVGEHLVSPGWMTRPRVLREVGTPPVERSGLVERKNDVAVLCHAARRRVASALLELVGYPAQDRFLRAALYSGRVRRSVLNGLPAWVPSPSVNDCLSDMVLSLFAADILVDQDLYRAHLSVCSACCRVAFTQQGQSDPSPCPRCSGERLLSL